MKKGQGIQAKKILILVKLLWITVIWISCDEVENPNGLQPLGDRTKIEGHVLEYGSGKPVPSATVYLREGIGMDLSGTINFESIDTLITDSLGMYKFEFKHLNGSILYEVKAEQAKYIPNEIGLYPGFLNKVNIILDPFAWIKIHIKNVNPYDERDYLFTSSNGGGGHYYGKSIDTTEIHIARGNRKVQLFWTITKNRNETLNKDSLYLVAFDTLFYEILY